MKNAIISLLMLLCLFSVSACDFTDPMGVKPIADGLGHILSAPFDCAINTIAAKSAPSIDLEIDQADVLEIKWQIQSLKISNSVEFWTKISSDLTADLKLWLKNGYERVPSNSLRPYQLDDFADLLANGFIWSLGSNKDFRLYEFFYQTQNTDKSYRIYKINMSVTGTAASEKGSFGKCKTEQ